MRHGGVRGVVPGAALADMAVEGGDGHAHALGDVAHWQLAFLHQRTRRGDVARLECRWAPAFAAAAAGLGKASGSAFADQVALELRGMRCTAY